MVLLSSLSLCSLSPLLMEARRAEGRRRQWWLCDIHDVTETLSLADNSETIENDGDLEEEPELRHVEKDVLIPKMMREKARELCSDKVQAFTKCCQESGFLMVVKCQQENAALKECLTTYYNDPAFYEECKIEYLKQREEFRATGIPAKQRQQKLPTSM
ncbi:COX assembly mitochondrial protein homolog isoform X1 [Malaclemys terrapin pileata]|nr:COX assembly mitochondrial protein homolog isoform X1 [Malaclemys terrapin pileata]